MHWFCHLEVIIICWLCYDIGNSVLHGILKQIIYYQSDFFCGLWCNSWSNGKIRISTSRNLLQAWVSGFVQSDKEDTCLHIEMFLEFIQYSFQVLHALSVSVATDYWHYSLLLHNYVLVSSLCSETSLNHCLAPWGQVWLSCALLPCSYSWDMVSWSRHCHYCCIWKVSSI